MFNRLRLACFSCGKRVSGLFLLICMNLPITVEAADTRPNFLIIVADDLGYTDMGAFGGEIETPNLDHLAKGGLRLTNFYAAPTCSPTRAMLLSGTDNHLAGLGNMAEELAPNQIRQKGYEGYLNSQVVSLAEVMKSNHYRTYMTGKWHLGLKENQSPAARGFKRSFALLQGGSNHYDPSGLPAKAPKSLYREDGKLANVPKDFYSSDFYASKLISYLSKDEKSAKPFLAYLAFTAPHAPLQAPDDLIRKYEARYLAGYQAILKQRLRQAEALDVTPATAEIDETFPGHKDWSTLSDQERRIEARKMAVYAAMVDLMDQNVGRVMKYLEDHGRLNNTYVIFMSDNGAEGHDFTDNPFLKGWIDEFDNSYDNMGRKNSFIWYGPNWAHVGTAPFRHHKGFPTEGGVHVPAFVYEPGLKVAGKTSKTVLSVKDIMPTILDLAKVRHPSRYRGHAVLPMQGRSFAGLLAGEAGVNEATPNIGWELFGKRGVRYGDWKIVLMPPPYGTGQWQLYNLKSDPGETRDISPDHPDRLKEMVKRWDDYAKTNNVILPDRVSGY